MTVEHIIIIALLGMMAIRELYFFYSTQKLINKIMSKSFYEYRMAETAGKRAEGFKAPKIDEREQEDLGILSEIGL